jgi:histidine ammonia-lyase
LKELQLNGSSLTIDQILIVSREHARVKMAEEALEQVRRGRETVNRILQSGKSVYGVNTGFGKLAERKIGRDELETLQVNLIRSHSVGTGPRLHDDEVRAAMVIRLNTLLKGHSGVRKEIVEQLTSFLNSDLIPEIPRYGSLGASGDLAPSAHLALTLIGEGNIVRNGTLMSAAQALRQGGLKAVKLKEKEGIALINGTQVMTGLGCLLVFDCKNLLDVLDIASAASVEALGGNLSPYDERVHLLRPLKGQIEVAQTIRRLLSGSKLASRSGRVQDPYSLRCIPQVHGAFREALDFARSMVEVEINSVTDNPIVFPEDDSVLSAGNFHGQPVALALDLLCIAVTEACVISERRVNKLLSSFNPKLPLFLTKKSGLNSGMMVLQYTAASLIAQNRVLATPASLDSANVSAGQEDHSSMGVTAALKCREAIDNAFKVVAIELMCACQAIDLLSPFEPGKGTARTFELVRKVCKALDEDRSLSGELEKLSAVLKQPQFRDSVFEAIETV